MVNFSIEIRKHCGKLYIFPNCTPHFVIISFPEGKLYKTTMFNLYGISVACMRYNNNNIRIIVIIIIKENNVSISNLFSFNMQVQLL